MTQKENIDTVMYKVEEPEAFSFEDMKNRIAFLSDWENGFLSRDLLSRDERTEGTDIFKIWVIPIPEK